MALPLILTPVEPITIPATLGQMVVPDGSFPGLREGDRLLTMACHTWEADDLYVMAFRGEPYGVWRCASTFDGRICCWKDGRRKQTQRFLGLRDFEDAVVAKVAGWLHIHSAAALRTGVRS